MRVELTQNGYTTTFEATKVVVDGVELVPPPVALDKLKAGEKFRLIKFGMIFTKVTWINNPTLSYFVDDNFVVSGANPATLVRREQ